MVFMPPHMLQRFSMSSFKPYKSWLLRQLLRWLKIGCIGQKVNCGQHTVKTSDFWSTSSFWSYIYHLIKGWSWFIKKSQELIKWWISLQNIDVDQKIMKFDCMLTTVDFLSNTTDFQPSEQLSEETWLVKLETLHGESLKHMWRHEDHWRYWKSILPWEIPNPSLGWLSRREFVWSTLEESLSMDVWNILRRRRENFAVWQLPLFNLLVLEG